MVFQQTGGTPGQGGFALAPKTVNMHVSRISFVSRGSTPCRCVHDGSEQERNLHVSSGEQVSTVSRVCKRCKQRYVAEENTPTACLYHPLNWSGGEKAKAVGFLRKSSSPEDSLSQTIGTGMLSFWDCCGADDYNAPGCTHGYHIPFGEETSDDVYH